MNLITANVLRHLAWQIAAAAATAAVAAIAKEAIGAAPKKA